MGSKGSGGKSQYACIGEIQDGRMPWIGRFTQGVGGGEQIGRVEAVIGEPGDRFQLWTGAKAQSDSDGQAEHRENDRERLARLTTP